MSQEMSGRERALRAMSFEPVDYPPMMASALGSVAFVRGVSGRTDCFEHPDEVLIAAYRQLGAEALGQLVVAASEEEWRAARAILERDSLERYGSVERVAADVERRIAQLEGSLLTYTGDEAAAHTIAEWQREQARLGDDMLQQQLRSEGSATRWWPIGDSRWGTCASPLSD